MNLNLIFSKVPVGLMNLHLKIKNDWIQLCIGLLFLVLRALYNAFRNCDCARAVNNIVTQQFLFVTEQGKDSGLVL